MQSQSLAHLPSNIVLPADHRQVCHCCARQTRMRLLDILLHQQRQPFTVKSSLLFLRGVVSVCIAILTLDSFTQYKKAHKKQVTLCTAVHDMAAHASCIGMNICPLIFFFTLKTEYVTCNKDVSKILIYCQMCSFKHLSLFP